MDLSLQLLDSINQRQDERFHSGRHLGFEFRGYLAHARIGAENRYSCP